MASEAHTSAELMDTCPFPKQETNFARIQMAAEDVWHAHQCRGKSHPPGKLCCSITECQFALYHVFLGNTKWKTQKILWCLTQQNIFVVMGHMLDPKFLHTVKTANLQPTCYPRLNSEANTSRETQPQGWQPCPNHRAELMLKSQWKGRGLCTDHFPRRCLLSVFQGKASELWF